MTQAKRFISGAVCPSCQVVDRIVIEAVTQAQESKSLNDMATEAIRRRCVSVVSPKPWIGSGSRDCSLAEGALKKSADDNQGRDGKNH